MQPLVQPVDEPLICFVTFVTHCSRVSERIVQFGVTDPEGKGLQPLVLTPDEQVLVAESLFDSAQRYGFAFVALNVLPDHVHAVLAAPNEKVLASHVRNLKIFSAQLINKRRNRAKGSHVWAQKFNRKPVQDEASLARICDYILQNHQKHQETWGARLLDTWDKRLLPLVQRHCVDADTACNIETRPDKGLQPLVQPGGVALPPPDKGLQPLVYDRPPGGFDVVIGNPPYVRQEGLAEFKDYFQRHYESYSGTADLYVYFMEKGVSLLAEGGLFGIIVSSSFLRTTFAEQLRTVLKQKAAVVRIVDFGGLAVFAAAKDTYVCIPLLARLPQAERVEIVKVHSLDSQRLVQELRHRTHDIPHERLSPQAWSLASDGHMNVFRKILDMGVPLGQYVQGKMFYGIKTGLNEAFVVTTEQRESIVLNSPESSALMRPFVGGKDIKRYNVADPGLHLIVVKSGQTRREMSSAGSADMGRSDKEAWRWFEMQYPGIAEHLRPFGERCQKRQDKGDFWWELSPCVYYEHMEGPKIIFPDICKGPRFFLDTSGSYIANTAYCLGNADPLPLSTS